MKRRIARYPWIADNLIGIAFVFSALYWIIESVVHAYVFHDSGIVEQVLFPSAREIWIRSLTGFYLILSGALVQHIINKRKTVERSHAEAHAELKSVLDSASWISIIATDADGIIVVFNTGAERMLGYAAEEMIGKRTPEVFHLKSEVEAHGKELSREFGRPIEGFEVFVARPKVRGYEEREWTYIRKDGSHLTVNLVVTVVRDEAGEIIGRVGIAQDISERKRTREALMHSEELLRATVESTADGILVVNEKGEVTHSNARFAQMWNIPQELIAARDDNKLLEYVLGQLEEPQSFLSKVQELYGTSREDLDTLHFKDGRVFERFSCPLIRGDRITGRVWSFRDITERKRIEEALQESEERWSSLARNVPDIIASVRRDGGILAINRTVTGVTSDQVVGIDIYDYISPDQHAMIREAIDRVFQTGEPESCRVRSAGSGERGTVTYETRMLPYIRNKQIVSVVMIGTEVVESDQETAERIQTNIGASEAY